jgi:glucoamylase
MSGVERHPAPGGPGIEPRWTSSAKSGVGTAFDGRSLVWFTISHGIVDEVYYPRVDQANTRDFGLLVTSARPGQPPLLAEEKRDTRSEVQLLAPGVPGYRLVNASVDGRFEIDKTVIADPERDVVLQRIRFRALAGSLADYRVYALLAPHIGNQGYGNDAWADAYKGEPMLFASRGAISIALASSVGWCARSCGFVGVNDGWHQLHEHGRLVDEFTEARDGNVAMTGEVDLSACVRTIDDVEVAEFILALGFGTGPAEAAQRARMSLASHFERVLDSYVTQWRSFHERTLGPRLGGRPLIPDAVRADAEREFPARADASLRSQRPAASTDPRDRTPIEIPTQLFDMFWESAAILAVHGDKRSIGAMAASLSIPWGQSKGDHELGGYHLVWARDLVECAGGMLAAGHPRLARRTLRYLMSTQEADGSWPQNMWLDGTAYWRGKQLDEVAFPILLTELLRREDALDVLDPWPMIRKAAGFIVREGPVTEQDRWEEDAGYSPFTLAVEVAALVVAAEYADRAGERDTAQFLRDTADAWNENIERWTYVTDAGIAGFPGVDGYYTRISPPDLDAIGDGVETPADYVTIRNRPTGAELTPYQRLVSPDALALVRFGLRDANDERIVNTVRVIDALLCHRTRTGPVWHRYNGDGYGEHEDGTPFDGTGVGRGWPLLVGERAHYELARGHPDTAMQLLGVMRAQASDGGMIPEQIWDAPDLPARELINGRPTGGAMPLAWAHAEYVKLVRSLLDGVVFDVPDATYERYVRQKVAGLYTIWSATNRARILVRGRVLRVQTAVPATVHWSTDGWRTKHDTAPHAVPRLGVWIADLDTTHLAKGAVVDFTLFYNDEQRWEGRDYRVVVEE